MGKRKRTGLASPSSDSMPCSSGRDLTPSEPKSSDPDNLGVFNPLSSVRDIMDIHGKQQPNSQLSLGQQHQYNLSRAMFLKRSRHHYGNQYSRRNSPNYQRAPNSFGKGGPSNDDRLCFKQGGRYGSELGNRPEAFAEFREKGLWRPERIRTNPLVIEAVSEGLKTSCGICERPLKWKPRHFGSNISSEEPSVAAVLVCGHIYHADCLEQQTHPEDIRDPPCPTCQGSSSSSSLATKEEAA